MPADVDRYVQEGKDQGMPEDKAWAIAWSRFCRKTPESDHCHKDEYFDGNGKGKEASAEKVAFRHLLEGAATPKVAGSAKLDPKVRRDTNQSLLRAGLDGNSRFRSTGQALAAIADTLADNGLELGEAVQAFDVKAPEGRITLDLAIMNEEDPFRPVDIFNSMLAFHWSSATDTGGIEAVAYLS